MATHFRLIAYATSAFVLSSCSADEPAVTQEKKVFDEQVKEQVSAPGTVALGQPVIRAEVLTVLKGTTVRLVKGTVHVTRRGEGIQLERPLTLEQDDLLQLSENSAVSVRIPGVGETDITYQHGEWFRFDVIEE